MEKANLINFIMQIMWFVPLEILWTLGLFSNKTNRDFFVAPTFVIDHFLSPIFVLSPWMLWKSFVVEGCSFISGCVNVTMQAASAFVVNLKPMRSFEKYSGMAAAASLWWGAPVKCKRHHFSASNTRKFHGRAELRSMIHHNPFRLLFERAR